MKKDRMKLIGLLLIVILFSGCYEVAGPSNTVSEVSAMNMEQEGPYTAHIYIINALANFTPIAGGVDIEGGLKMDMEVLFTYSGTGKAYLSYKISGLSCGTSGSFTTLDTESVTLQEGAIHNGMLSYTYTGCSLVAGQALNLVFNARDTTTGLTFSEPIYLTIN